MILKKYLLLSYFIVLIAALALGAVIYISKNAEPFHPQSSREEIRPHVYKNSEKDISKIRIEIFYAIPKNKIGLLDRSWKEELANAIQKIVEFHALQFRGLSKIYYDIFPEPVVLENDDLFYDTAKTNAGNPHGLVNVAQEISRRVFKQGGDLYDKKLATANSSEYRIMGIVYEGVGASGGVIYDSPLKTVSEIAEQLGVPESTIYIVDINSVDSFFLVNRREYLTKDNFELYGSSIFYHEFAHAIGLPDTFDSENGPSTDDIMGTGRTKPIEMTYVDRSFLKEMGVY